MQDDRFATDEAVTLVPLTTDPTEASLVRIIIEPDASNGLRETSRAMADKVTTVSRARLGKRIGAIADAEMRQIERAMAVFLGLAQG